MPDRASKSQERSKAMGLNAVILAAGQGTRMKSPLPKVLHKVAGRPLLSWVLQAVAQSSPTKTVVVIGYGADQVRAIIPDGIDTVIQEPQKGTGHAASVGLDHLARLDSDDRVLVVNGDLPLLSAELLTSVAEAAVGRAAAFVTVEMPDPSGYGRIVRDDLGRVVGVVEEGDASPEQAAIREVNAGLYCFRYEDLAKALAQIRTDNVQGELYLTDVIDVLVGNGKDVVTVSAEAMSAMGVNSHDQLAIADAEARSQLATAWMRRGVWMQDPGRVYIDADVELESGVRIYPGVHLEGATKVGEGATLGPDSFIVDSVIGAKATVSYAVVRGSVVGEDADVGPYASLRPGTVLGVGAKAGTFVEVKNTTIGEGAKVPHLSYMGDAEIGAGANIGAGSITCNFDGVEKHRTVIGKDAFIGSDTMLVAPLTIGEGAVTGAGSVITRDVEPGALAVERSAQKDVPNYTANRTKKADRRTGGDRHT
jgi:bifunctional UDP-N-acetylglucosamine pyrophosphorylase/glucosamine-1-phosphate N-acetyltransferase